MTTETVLRFFVSVAFVTLVSSVLPAQAAAQMATAPSSAGYKREPGMISSSMPAVLRGIVFDQNIDQRVPLGAVNNATRASLEVIAPGE